MPLAMFKIGDDIDRHENSLRYHTKEILNIDPTFHNFVTTVAEYGPCLHSDIAKAVFLL